MYRPAVFDKLFTRIFLTFWIVTCAVLASWLLSASYFDERAQAQWPRHERAATAPPRFILKVLFDLQHSDQEDLAAVIERATERHNIELYLLRRDGTAFAGPEPTAQIRDAARDVGQRQRRAVLHTADGRIVAYSLRRADSGPLRAIVRPPKPRSPALVLLGANPLLRLGLAIAVSGLLCLILSRAITRRLRDLQSAARDLATGNLDTRLQVRSRGGDETDDLARDFNSMAEQLQARVQAQKRLLGDVSHELRSPLARLRVALALAQEDPESRGKYLQRIEREAERLEALISQLLVTETGALEHRASTDLYELLSGICEGANFEGQARDIGVVLESTVDDAFVSTAGDLLQKCFDNLLRNALKYSPQGTTVTVRLTSEGDVYVVTVSDQGPGVPDEDLPRLTEPLYRVDTARTREAGGYGMGLSIAAHAVALHNGEMHLENRHPGLRVIVRLPCDETTKP